MPTIPNSNRVLNALLRPATAGRRRPDRAFDRLLAEAERAGDGAEEEDEEFLDTCRALLREYAAVDGVTSTGWRAMLADLDLRVRNRLRVRRLHRERPELARERIEAPVFVVGLPRTATTLTSEVIARSEGHRGPLLWEMTCTDLDVPEKRRREYVRAVARSHRSLGRLAPRYRAAQALDVESPADSAHLLPHGSHHLMRADLPGYRAWLADRDWRGDYEHLKRALQVLQHGRPAARWILHSPAHLDHLPTIHDLFPDARFAWVHRDPVTVMGSLCSLVESVTALHVKNADPHRIGATWLGLTAASVERARAARLRLPRGSIIDVPYLQVMADPYRTVPLLYERLGARWGEADGANLAAALEGPGIGRAHEYELARYGLTTSQVEDAFGDYLRTIRHLRLR